MRRMILLGGMLLVVAGVTSLVFKVPKQVAAQHVDLASPAETTNPARLNTPWQFNKPWQDLREEMALP
jgi:hypothetical protein